MTKKIPKIAGVIVALYALAAGTMFVLMLQGPSRFAATMRYVPWPAFVVLPFKPMWDVARAGRHAVGEPAPDFSLQTTDHQDTVQLSSFRGQKPVVLVFGSYT